jgi:hypothetical protein
MIKEINIRERIITEQSDNNNVLKNYIALLEKSEGVAYTILESLFRIWQIRVGHLNSIYQEWNQLCGSVNISDWK